MLPSPERLSIQVHKKTAADSFEPAAVRHSNSFADGDYLIAPFTSLTMAFTAAASNLPGA
jgi:hypothetical protein